MPSEDRLRQELAYEDLAYVSAELRLTRLQRLGAWLVGEDRCAAGEACADFRGFAASVTKLTPPDLRRTLANFGEVEARFIGAFGAQSTEVQLLRDVTS